MANTKLIFFGSVKGQTEENSLECFHNSNNEISFFIRSNFDNKIDFITFDRSTAIKLHRELKKQISFITEEVSNG